MYLFLPLTVTLPPFSISDHRLQHRHHRDSHNQNNVSYAINRQTEKATGPSLPLSVTPTPTCTYTRHNPKTTPYKHSISYTL